MKKIAFILFLPIIAMACNATNAQKNSFEDINQQKMQKMMAQKDVVIMDVRTPGEVAEGYIKGAQLFIDVKGSVFVSKIKQLDTSKKYIVYCRSGARSRTASSLLIENGFTNVYNLEGGISQWTGETTR